MALKAEAVFESPLGDDSLLLRRMHAREEFGRLFEFRLELLRDSEEDPVEPKEILGKAAAVTVQAGGGNYRHFHGVVSSFERGGSVAGGLDVYFLILRPWLWQLTLGADCRIFQDKTAIEILDELFEEYGSKAQVDKKLDRSYAKRAFTVQYRETDYDFALRLMEEEGIYYHFRHEKSKHTLILCDGPGGHKDIQGLYLFWSPEQQGSKHERDDVITQWSRIHSLQPLQFTTEAFAPEKPKPVLTGTAKRAVPYPKPSSVDALEVYDHPGRHEDEQMAEGASALKTGAKQKEGDRLAGFEVARFESLHSLSTALTPHRPLAVANTFKFKDHPDTDDYLVTSSITVVEQSGFEGASDDVGTSYHCRFDAVPKSITFQPQRVTETPVVHGPQTATVVGPKGDEIHTDKHGRVKVLFHWDRVGRKKDDGKSSCFVRVSQPWAGKGFGFVSLPRIGDEVVVEFLEGNPDRPLITGRVYNGDNPPPWKLPDQATVTGVRTRSSKGGEAGNFNELRFDDKKGSEYVWFQAEKDYHQWVKNDATVSVLGNRSQEIKKDDASKVGGKLDAEVVKQLSLKIGEDAHATVGGDLNLKVDGATGLTIVGATALKGTGKIEIASGAAIEVDATAGMKLSTMGNVHIKAATGIVIDGGVQLAIKAGAAFITLGPEGVSISGPIVKINSGGSAGSAADAAKANPAQPKTPPAPKEHKDPLAK